MADVQLRPDQLFLDHENPRNRVSETQREALQAIIREQAVKIANLADSIASQGMSPLDRMLVYKSSDRPARYVVLEGNRRLAALKILRNPAVLDDLLIPGPLRARLQRVAGRFNRNSIKTVAAHLVDTREDGEKWIKLRHSGEQGGRGTINWGALQDARFAVRTGTSGVGRPALQALTMVLEGPSLSEVEYEAVSRLSFTLVDRLLGSSDVRDVLGLEIVGGVIQKVGSPEQLAPTLKLLILKLAMSNETSRSLNTTRDQLIWVRSWIDELPVPDHLADGDASSDAGPQPAASRTAADSTPKAPAAALSKQPRERKAESQRKKLVAGRTRLNIIDSKAEAIFAELRKLNVGNTPNAVAVLLRVFLEMSVNHYLEATNLGLFKARTKPGSHREEKNLASKVTECIDHIVAAGANPKDFHAVRRAVAPDGMLNATLLNDYVHNKFVQPYVADLVACWENALPLFSAVWAQETPTRLED